MARPSIWTESELLATVVPLFHRKGYAHTSLKDIEQATGLHPGSIYKAYGSKQALFLAAVRAYNNEVVARRVQVFLHEVAEPLPGIHAFFTSTVDAPDDPNPGCLLTNTAIESFVLEPSVRPDVEAGLGQIESGLCHALERAQVAGQLDSSMRIDDVAAQLLALYQGLLVLIRFGAPRTRLTAVIDQALPAITRPVISRPAKTHGR